MNENAVPGHANPWDRPIHIAATAVAALVLCLCVAALNPFATNGDDIFFYYFQGHVGATVLAGGPALDALQKEMARSRESLDPTLQIRFDNACVAYSPVNIALSAIGERVRSTFFPGRSRVVAWCLAWYGAFWVLALGVIVLLVWRRLPSATVAWFIGACVLVVAMFFRDPVLAPPPRCLGALATGVGLCLLAERRGGLAAACLAFAALCHPYHQVFNLCVAGAAILLLHREGAKAVLRDSLHRRVALAAVVSVAVSFLIVQAATATNGSTGWHLFAKGKAFNLLANWRENRKAFESVTRGLGALVLVASLANTVGRWRNGLLLTVMFQAGLVGVAYLKTSPTHPGEFVYRYAMAWTPVVIAMLVRIDLLARLGTIAGRQRRRIALVVILALLVVPPVVFWKRWKLGDRPILKVAWPTYDTVAPREREFARVLTIDR